MKEGNIGSGQLLILLLVSRCFNILYYVPAFSESIEPTAILIGNAVSFGIQLLLLIPPLLLFRHHDGSNVITVAYDRWKPLGWTYAVLYFIITFAQLSGTLVGFEYFMTSAVYPNASTSFLIITMSLACFWCGRHGLEGLTRASVIVFLFLLVSVCFICGVSLRSVDLRNLHPILSDPANSIFRAAMSSLSKSGELYLLILLYPKVKGSVGKCSFGFVLTSFLMLEVTYFVILGVLGEYGFTQTFPYYTLASISDTDLLQRLDSLHMMNWVFSSFIRCTLLVIIGKSCIQTILPQKTHRWILPLLFLLATSAAIGLSYSTELIKSLNQTGSFGVGVTVLTAGLPLLVLLIAKRRKPYAPIQPRPQNPDTSDTVQTTDSVHTADSHTTTNSRYPSNASYPPGSPQTSDPPSTPIVLTDSD